MEFGHLADEELAATDFGLPTDSAFTLDTLAMAEETGTFNVHVGLSKWQHNTWKGKLFPSRTNPTEFLSLYAKNFNAIEFNASFYTIFQRKKQATGTHRWGNRPASCSARNFPSPLLTCAGLGMQKTRPISFTRA